MKINKATQSRLKLQRRAPSVHMSSEFESTSTSTKTLSKSFVRLNFLCFMVKAYPYTHAHTHTCTNRLEERVRTLLKVYHRFLFGLWHVYLFRIFCSISVRFSFFSGGFDVGVDKIHWWIFGGHCPSTFSIQSHLTTAQWIVVNASNSNCEKKSCLLSIE